MSKCMTSGKQTKTGWGPTMCAECARQADTRPTPRDYAGTAFINLSVARDTGYLDEVKRHLSMAVDGLCSAGEPAMAEEAEAIRHGVAPMSAIDTIIDRLVEKYNLHRMEV